MAKKVTIYDIADKLMLSPSTVSRALADNSLINIKTRTRVKKAAKEMGYMENLRSADEADTVVMIVPRLDSYFYSRVIRSTLKSLAVQTSA